MPITKIYFNLFFLLVCSSISFSQANLKVGYAGAVSNFAENNKILRSYNESNGKLDQKFKNLHILHGLVVGGRYRISNMAWEINWMNQSKSLDAFGTTSSNSVFTKSLYYSLNSYSIGIENYIGKLGFGYTLDRRNLRIRTNIPGIDSKKKISSESEFSSQVSLIYEVQSSPDISFVVKTFVQIPWGAYSLDAISKELLDVSVTMEEKPWIYGLSFIFYNGPQ